MKANKHGTEWLGQARDPIWTAMANKKNGRIMRKYAKGSASVELMCFILTTVLLIGLVVWLVKTVVEL
jgi:hypothetical protein